MERSGVDQNIAVGKDGVWKGQTADFQRIGLPPCPSMRDPSSRAEPLCVHE